ncbi:unnamed protein product, partial [Rotaria sp. Silwood1]
MNIVSRRHTCAVSKRALQWQLTLWCRA